MICQSVSGMMARMAAARRTRTYDSPLRAEQVDHTRRKLIEAGVDLVAKGGSEDVTVRRVAALARISVPTAYRYFPDRDALLEGIATFISARVVGAQAPRDADGLPAWAQAIFRGFEDNNLFMRAQLNTPVGRTIRARSRKGRNQAVVEATKHSFPAASPTVQRRIAALIRVLVNVHTWVQLNDDWGMSGAEAGELIGWAIAALVGEARRHPGGLEFDGGAPSK